MSAPTSLSTAPSQLMTGPGEDKDDRRSSSLSDIGERVDQDLLENANTDGEDNDDGNDTEAETERMDDSPAKRREYRNVLLSTAAAVDEPMSNAIRRFPESEPSQSLSEASSPPESSDEEGSHSIAAPVSPHKRKRADEDDFSEGNGDNVESPRGRKSPFGSSTSLKSPSDTQQQSSRDSPSSRAPSVGDLDRIRSQGIHAQAPSPSSPRSDKPVSEDEMDILENDLPLQGIAPSMEDEPTIESNVEEMDGDENVEAELESASKNLEEVAKKRSALDSLSALEKCFATLRDRLFDERLAAANEELSLLQRPDCLHPELLAMKEAVDRHRQQKENYQQTFLKLKLETLQRESVATKHQIQSQYMQTVRQLRDKSLDNVNKEFYQVQRERRNVEHDVPDTMFLYSNDRPQQVRQQTAYNNEVSVLAGVAKYKGFPAAPELKSIRTAELEEDLRTMGVKIVTRPTQNWQQRHAGLRNEAPGPSPLNRQVSSAEEVFLERNAWANPHHPVHQQRFNRQSSNLSSFGLKKNQPASDATAEVEAAPVPGAAASSPTQANAPSAFDRTNTTLLNRAAPQVKPNEQSNAHNELARFNRESEPSSVANVRPVITESPLLARSNFNWDSHASTSVQRAITLAQSSGTRASPPSRLPGKPEDAQVRTSPTPHKFSSPAAAITAGNGQAR